MRIELTEQQRRVVEEQRGAPVEVLDPSTMRAYVLIVREQYEQVRSLLQAGPAATVPATTDGEIPPGLRRSMDAFWRDLPELLSTKKLRGQWVCYHADERVSIASSERDLIRECLRRGLRDGEYYTDVIEPRTQAPWEDEEIETRPWHSEEVDEPDPSATPS